jgi:hypothetical protein
MAHTPRLAFVSLALSCCLALAGCGEEAAAPDAGGGMDGGTGDAGERADAMPRDAGGAQVCEGTANPCALLTAQADCDAVLGCNWSQCAGFAVACAMLRTEAMCTGSAGCSWSGVSCGGTPAECGSFTEPSTCGGQTGCTWSTVAQCRGAATPCEMLDDVQCAAQPGCRPYMAPVDAGRPDGGPPPTCDGGVPGACVPPTPPTSIVGCNPERGIECDGDWSGVDARGEAFCTPACAATECCSPRDGRFSCLPRHADGSCPAADIFIDPDQIEGRTSIEWQEFRDDSCEIAEACVGGTGMRRLLRFDTWTPNIGEADLFLGRTPAGGTSTETFSWSACHGHHHFDSYAEYELLTPGACCVAGSGHKQAFCLIDLARHDSSVGSDRAAYNCGYQGIQRGWQDVYSAGLDCQFVDVTDVPAGDYILRIRVNVEHILLESDYSNNEINVPVHID